MARWISVKKRLPRVLDHLKRSSYVLVWADDSVHVAFYHHERKCWDDGDYQDDLAGVTHWQKLPVKPEIGAEVERG